MSLRDLWQKVKPAVMDELAKLSDPYRPHQCDVPDMRTCVCDHIASQHCRCGKCFACPCDTFNEVHEHEASRV